MHYHASQYYTSTACGGSRQAGRGTSGFSIVSKRTHVTATVSTNSRSTGIRTLARQTSESWLHDSRILFELAGGGGFDIIPYGSQPLR